MACFILGMPFQMRATSEWNSTRINIFIALSAISTIEGLQICPYLYDRNECTTEEQYVSFLQKRIDTISPLFGKIDENAFNLLKSELHEHYEKILHNRSLFSIIFESSPKQPLALLDQEISQHINQLDWYQLNSTYRKIKIECFGASETINYHPDFLNKVLELKKSLMKLKKIMLTRTDFQLDCALARQETNIARVECLLQSFIYMFATYWYTQLAH